MINDNRKIRNVVGCSICSNLVTHGNYYDKSPSIKLIKLNDDKSPSIRRNSLGADCIARVPPHRLHPSPEVLVVTSLFRLYPSPEILLYHCNALDENLHFRQISKSGASPYPYALHERLKSAFQENI